SSIQVEEHKPHAGAGASAAARTAKPRGAGPSTKRSLSGSRNSQCGKFTKARFTDHILRLRLRAIQIGLSPGFPESPPIPFQTDAGGFLCLLIFRKPGSLLFISSP